MVAANDEFVAFGTRTRWRRSTSSSRRAQHLTSLDVIEQLGPDAVGRLLHFVAAVAREQGVHETGYRVVTNIGPDAGQEVFHLHWHLIGGRRMGEMA